MTFGEHVRERRLALERERGRSDFSLRQVASRIQVQPSYLSRIERDDVKPPSEEKVKELAAVLEEDPDLLLAMAGKLSTDLKEIINKRADVFADLIRQLKTVPDQAIIRIVREVRDGDW
jgi:HTH-type transcriptional regulator, competence development regulator